jgi:CheY-like chemotaxis protein
MKYIMLVDDSPDDNFFHEREIKKANPENIVITKDSGQDALEYLQTEKVMHHPHPDLIFLDINMPGMNGWEFLQEYGRLGKELQSRALIIMLTTSENPDDEARAKSLGFISDYITKPLTKALMDDIISKYFKEYDPLAG